MLLVGLGAVSTTTIAGVLAIRKGLAKPIGSLTQMGTIRLGKRTEGRSPKINDVVPLATLDDLVFGGWDIFEEDCYAAARTAGVLEPSLLDQIRPELEQIRPWPAVFDQRYVKRLDGPERQEGQEQEGPRRAGDRRHPQVQAEQQPRSPRDGLVRQHRDLHDRVAGARRRSRAFERGARGERSGDSRRAWSTPTRRSARAFRTRTPRPNLTADIPALVELAAQTKSPLAGKDLKTGQTLIKTIIAPGLKARLLGVEGWYSTNILGNRDGEVLDDPESFKTKEESKKSALDYIFQPQLYPELYAGSLPRRPHQLLPAARRQQGRLGQHRSGRLARLPDAAQDQLPVPRQHPRRADRARRRAVHGSREARRACHGIQEWLSFYFKSPVHAPGLYPEHDLFIQLMKLKNTLRYLKGEELITHLGREYYD